MYAFLNWIIPRVICFRKFAEIITSEQWRFTIRKDVLSKSHYQYTPFNPLSANDQLTEHPWYEMPRHLPKTTTFRYFDINEGFQIVVNMLKVFVNTEPFEQHLKIVFLCTIQGLNLQIFEKVLALEGFE